MFKIKAIRLYRGHQSRMQWTLTFSPVCLGSEGHYCGSQLFSVRQRWYTGCKIPRSPEVSPQSSVFMNELPKSALWRNSDGPNKGFTLGANSANNKPHSSHTDFPLRNELDRDYLSPLRAHIWTLSSASVLLLSYTV